MLEINEKTFITISISLITTLAVFIFGVGIAYNRLGNVEREVSALRSDFNKYVLDARFQNKADITLKTTNVWDEAQGAY